MRTAVWQHTAVAVKEVTLAGGTRLDAGAVAALHAEVALHWSLRHPHIVAVFGSFEDLSDPARPRYGIVMELCARSVYAALHPPPGLGPGASPAHPPLTPAARLRICVDVASGLAYLHAQSPAVVHADLKSLNVLLDEHGKAKLADFGLSSFRSTLQLHSQLSTGGGGGAGTGVGTLLWMAPELHSDESRGGRPARPSLASDVYALGVTLWEVLSGALPFSHVEHLNYASLPFLVLRGERPSLAQLAPGAPDGVAQLLAALWAHKPSERPSASEAVAALRRLGGADTTPLRATAAAAAAGRAQRR